MDVARLIRPRLTQLQPIQRTCATYALCLFLSSLPDGQSVGVSSVWVSAFCIKFYQILLPSVSCRFSVALSLCFELVFCLFVYVFARSLSWIRVTLLEDSLAEAMEPAEATGPSLEEAREKVASSAHRYIGTLTFTSHWHVYTSYPAARVEVLFVERSK